MSRDQARVSIALKVPPADAFRIFTREIDQWWLHGRKFRVLDGRARSIVYLEERAGGGLFERLGEQVIKTGEITVWDPPARLVFDWRGANLVGEDKTEVEVAFTAQGSGTLVTLTHRGWARIRDDHPVRHGLSDRDFLRTFGLWWGELMTSLRTLAAPSLS
jgi:uncharacterized protein YndB with AHSA1/START domain